MFKSVTRSPSLTDRTLHQVQTLIINRSLRAGERLPAERDLGEMLSVSRTVVREAIRLLTAKGLVEVRSGSGTFVCDLGPGIMKEPMDLLLQANVLKMEQIQEVREALEVTIAGLAAQRAKATDLKAMQETIKALTRSKLHAAEFASTDVAFHNCLANATHNPLFSILVNSLNSVMLEVRLRLFNNLSRMPDRAMLYHARILDRVKANDVKGARVAMEEHLLDTRDLLRQASAQVRKKKKQFH